MQPYLDITHTFYNPLGPGRFHRPNKTPTQSIDIVVHIFQASMSNDREELDAELPSTISKGLPPPLPPNAADCWAWVDPPPAFGLDVCCDAVELDCAAVVLDSLEVKAAVALVVVSVLLVLLDVELASPRPPPADDLTDFVEVEMDFDMTIDCGVVTAVVVLEDFDVECSASLVDAGSGGAVS
jgi:hypothetical protein